MNDDESGFVDVGNSAIEFFHRMVGNLKSLKLNKNVSVACWFLLKD